MKIKKSNNLKVSVLIANFNNEKYIKRCVNSVLQQTYKNIEIILFDDLSTDGSLDVIKKFKNKIKIILNKNKTHIGSYDQINAYLTAMQKSSGDILFFLDSDDFFHKSKIFKIIKFYKNNNQINYLMDKPYVYYDECKMQKLAINRRGTFFTPWPRFSPQSCMSIKRNYLTQFIDNICLKKFPTVWLDFRLAINIYLKEKKINICNNHLTYYQQIENSASSKYPTFSVHWWKRRYEAHQYFQFVAKKFNKSFLYSFDYFLTFLINKFI